MIILGIDPGTATTGFAFIGKNEDKLTLLDYGCIKTEARKSPAERFHEIIENLESLIDEWSPCQAAIEEIYFSANVKTAIAVAQSRGAILHHLYKKNIQISEYNPLQIKTAICGHGKAKKPEIQKMIQLIFSLPHPPHPDDAADAIAIAYCQAINYYPVPLA